MPWIEGYLNQESQKIGLELGLPGDPADLVWVLARLRKSLWTSEIDTGGLTKVGGTGRIAGPD
jgi:hypothetical protein